VTGFDAQPNHLANAAVRLSPLREDDFEALHAVASDPLLWAQHPNPDRYRRDVFRTFFDGAMASRGAFLVRDATTDAIVGCSRYYDHDAADRSVLIGYTFVARSRWGTGVNPALKRLMLDHAFRQVDRVLFHIGEHNLRSQVAIGRLGARKIAEKDVAYFGEAIKRNFVYEIGKVDWPPRTR
jgi:RimJ/RimL family protein N-acetyltransferase